MPSPARRPFTVAGTTTAGACLGCSQPASREPLILHTAPAESLTDPMPMCTRCTAGFYGHTMTTVRLAVRVLALPDSIGRTACLARLDSRVTVPDVRKD